MRAYEELWRFADTGNFAAVVAMLRKGGCAEGELGAEVIRAGQQALAEGRLATARRLLAFVAEATDHAEDAYRLRRIVEEIGRQEAEVGARTARGRKEARERDARKLKEGAERFVRLQDLAGLLAWRDSMIGVLSVEERADLHRLVDEMVQRMVEDAAEHREGLSRLQANRRLLPDILPCSAPSLERKIHEVASGQRLPGRIRFAGRYFVRRDGVWRSDVAPEAWERKSRSAALERNMRTLVVCGEEEGFAGWLAGLRSGAPDVIKFDLFFVVREDDLVDAMYLHDLSVVVDCDFVVNVLIDEDIERQCHELFYVRKKVFPSVYLCGDAEKKRFISHLLSGIEQRALQNYQRLRALAAQLYPPGVLAAIREKIRRGERLRILFLTSRYTTYLQFCTRDMVSGFRALGHATEVLLEEEGHGVGIRLDVSLERLCAFRPDIIFCIDHGRYELPWVPKEIPFVTWVQDRLGNLFEIGRPDVFSAADYVYSSSSTRRDILAKDPAYRQTTVRLLPYLLEPSIYRPLELPLRYDVSYVAHQDFPAAYLEACGPLADHQLTNDGLLHRRIMRYTDRMSLEDLSALYADDGWQSLTRFLRGFCQEFSLPLSLINEDMLRYMRDVLLFVLLRVRPLKALLDAGVDVHVFGRGWEEHPWFQACAKGPVANGDALNRVINQTAINLNINPFISFHNKVPEVLGAGGFLLSRRVGRGDLMPLTDFFVENEEVVLFDDEDDLVEKVRFFLAHPEERRRIAQAGHQRVLQEFTVEAGAKKILRDIAAG